MSNRPKTTPSASSAKLGLGSAFAAESYRLRLALTARERVLMQGFWCPSTAVAGVVLPLVKVTGQIPVSRLEGY